jgi:hypothetical protein
MGAKWVVAAVTAIYPKEKRIAAESTADSVDPFNSMSWL